MTGTANSYLDLTDRGLIAVGGSDARDFLQNLVSNDISRVTPTRAVYAALLTPQGKYLFDFFVVQLGETLLLDCEAARRDDLIRRLSMYRLRADVSLDAPGDAADDSLTVAAFHGAAALAALDLDAEPGTARALDGGLVYVDPRLASLGARAILPRETLEAVAEAAGFSAGEAAGYDAMRLALGVPDGSRDLEVEKSVLLENGFDELHGVDWDKGCYIGQEITARTHYRGLVKKRLVPVAVDGPLPAAGTKVMQDGREAGIMRSGRGGAALALLRIDAVERAGAGEAPLTAGEARLEPKLPAWAAG